MKWKWQEMRLKIISCHRWLLFTKIKLLHVLYYIFLFYIFYLLIFVLKPTTVNRNICSSLPHNFFKQNNNSLSFLTGHAYMKIYIIIWSWPLWLRPRRPLQIYFDTLYLDLEHLFQSCFSYQAPYTRERFFHEVVCLRFFYLSRNLLRPLHWHKICSAVSSSSWQNYIESFLLQVNNAKVRFYPAMFY